MRRASAASIWNETVQSALSRLSELYETLQCSYRIADIGGAVIKSKVVK